MIRWSCLALVALSLTSPDAARAQAEPGWVEMLAEKDFKNWLRPHGEWQFVSEVSLLEKNPQLLTGTQPAGPIIYNGAAGRAPNLISREQFGDIELHTEFLVAKGSNSGIKFIGVYEIQIFDSHDEKKITASGNGGIYPRAERLPYHHIDEGYPPLVNASLPPGVWQSLDIVFRAPKFDIKGRKIANAQFESVVLNGKTIHSHVDVAFPTGHAWHNKEVGEGPILLQGDHGPVAFRNVRVKRLEAGQAEAAAVAEMNRQFLDPNLDPSAWAARFEAESREIFAQRTAIADLVQIQPGESIADVGAGTGLFTRIFADRVGKFGTVYAIDISTPFLFHIDSVPPTEKQGQIETVIGRPDSIVIPNESVDAVFLCDTYHHFEDPAKVLASIHRALKPNGRLILVEFDRREGKSSDFILKHIRADQTTFKHEIEQAGFRPDSPAARPTLQENFVATFRKVDPGKTESDPAR